MTLNITVLISGSGTNLQALIDAEKNGKLKGKITQVISSSDTAFGLTRAERASIPTKTHILKEYYKGTTKEQKDERKAKRELFNSDLANLLIYGNIKGEKEDDYIKPNLIVCAGWMLILSPIVLEPLAKAGITIINLHPALPGAFEGTHAIDRCWKAGQDGEITKGGVMIHRVIAEVDRGEPILVKEIDLKKEETLEEYEDRVHKVEHVAIVEGTNIILDELSVDEASEALDKLKVKN
ncbi:phosphoribosylglycinamide formyltransferase [Spathaspora passalidarum NRRL Y-27907]|uniref:Phosphoribosylglycinamide formyltransferase n=1 Tax=Spathaspora passalidarum (strain NRRL Y-27907 / 11-Y1) TaxID=619300 RepID=G3AMK9_SPAPN|nr:phosphoribosylglycinamide formyltransferase [Spathaspora passalidarum NRRL Y-27907]EGW33453.1 phosphoribosylglycinamide formyltransferase [Spathaspora passalidarum NRRL Y-27907]